MKKGREKERRGRKKRERESGRERREKEEKRQLKKLLALYISFFTCISIYFTFVSPVLATVKIWLLQSTS